MDTSAWKRIVPHLAALHRAGHLVPFIGSGMSVGVCSGWDQLIQGLCEATGLEWAPLPEGKEAKQEQLLRRADDATRVLRSWTGDRRRKALVAALFEPTASSRSVPRQTVALAKLQWPLVVTTNYEDVFWHAASPRHGKRDMLEVRGRSLSDCHAVLRSLDWPSPPILWAIQGFLGGPYRRPEEVIREPARRESLLSELVIGHRQYQEATHLNSHFRRAFAEVFRRRAFVFLGSGITETYLTNLFSEVLTVHGQRAGSHFALMKSDTADEAACRFLSDRLGIFTCIYENHEVVIDFLESLSASAGFFMSAGIAKSPAVDVAVELSSLQYRMRLASGTEAHITLDNGHIIDDAHRERVLWATSVGRSGGPAQESLHNGRMTDAALRALGLSAQFSTSAVRNYLYPHQEDARLIAVAARPALDASTPRFLDRRSLSAIQVAMSALLEHATASEEVDAVRVGLLSAGSSAPWHPLFALVAMLGAIREFLHRSSACPRIEISIHDPRVWTRVASGMLPVQVILSSARLPVLVRIESTEPNDADTIVHMADQDASVADVLKHLQLRPSDWKWSMIPAPDSREPAVQQAHEAMLVPYSTVVLQPATRP